MGEPCSASPTAASDRNGGADQDFGAARVVADLLPESGGEFAAFLGRPFIFQLPAMRGGRMGTQDYTCVPVRIKNEE
jgi:hypothetical protein